MGWNPKNQQKIFFNLKRVLNINNSENREILPQPKKGTPSQLSVFKLLKSNVD
tara:strand:- start:35840 stop:35998 length:159 start_codon:yes stop_codon:yes gene_type:complete